MDRIATVGALCASATVRKFDERRLCSAPWLFAGPEEDRYTGCNCPGSGGTRGVPLVKPSSINLRQRGRRRRVHLHLCLLLSCSGCLVALSGCTAPARVATNWRLDWSVTQQDRWLRPSQEVVTLPDELVGEETWWAEPGQLTIRSRGEDRTGEAGESWTWIHPGRGWVWSYETATGNVRGTPWSLWVEERRRQSRAWHQLAAELREERSDPALESFGGDLTRRTLPLSRGGVWHAVAAAPGRLWKLSGPPQRGFRWQRPELVWGFAGVAPRRATALRAILSRVRPERVDELGLPLGSTLPVTIRRLARVRSLPPAPEVRQLRLEVEQQVQSVEDSRADFQTLWGFLEHPESRPQDLNAREVRARLENVVGPAEVPLLKEAVSGSDDTNAREELLHLLFTGDEDSFRAWFDAAVEGNDLGLILPMVSVLSLRRPQGVADLVEELLDASPELWDGVDLQDRRAIRAWLGSLQAWLQQGERLFPEESSSSASENPTTQAADPARPAA